MKAFAQLLVRGGCVRMRAVLLLWLMASAPAVAIEPALVSVGETWAYQPGTTALPAGWMQPGFDDSAWRRGPSGFGLTFRGENTLFVGLPRGYVTMYFRKEFVVTDAAEIEALALRLDWHGGIVAYLNGAEFHRFGLGAPGSPVTHTNFGGLRIAGAAEDLSVPRFREWLRTGTNLLAIEVHLTNPLFDIVLVPELLANFTRGPYVQTPVSGAMDVVWRTPLPGPAKVEYGPTPALGLVANAQSHPAYAFAILTNLNAAADYHYRVTVQTERGTVSSPIYRCRTLPASGPMTALLFGDSGSGARSQFEVAREFGRQSATADLFVHLGDIVYEDFTIGQTDTRCLSVYRETMRSLPTFFSWGNHDLPYGPVPFQSAFRMPTNNTSALDHLEDHTQSDFYYSFDAGDAHFAVLFWPYSSQYSMRPDCPQLRWLEADLAASGKRWKFLCLHHPVNTSGAHRWDDMDLNRVEDRLEVQARLLPLAKRHGVRAIFSGHDHHYERFHPVEGVHTVISGGGGVGLYGLTERDTNSAAFVLRWHLTRLEIRDDFLRLIALDTSGSPLDVLEFRDTPADSADPDGDGLGTLAEELTGSDPRKPDTDGDGLPDGWEFLRGLDPAKPMVTPSADGVTGPGDPRWLAEFLAEPIPRPATELRVHRLPDGRVQLRWLGVVGARIEVETAPSADGKFAPLESVAPRALAEDRQALELPVGPTAQFFRVQPRPEP
jgi:hypothetical protein